MKQSIKIWALGALLFGIVGVARAQSSAQSWDSPTQYAFIADAALPSIAVVDVDLGEQVGLLRTQVAAKVFASSTDEPLLAYSDKDNWAFYIVDLQTLETKKIETPAAVYDLRFVPNTPNIAVVLEEQVGMYARDSQTLTVLPRRFQNLYTRFETIFSIFSQTFWIMQENTPLIYRYRFSAPNPQWETINLGYDYGLGSGAPSFEDDILAVNSYYADKAFIYDIDQAEVVAVHELYDSRHLNRRLVKPYVDGATRRVVFADLSGEVVVYDRWSDTPNIPQTVNVGFPITEVTTGWLDDYLIAGGVEALTIRPFDDLEAGEDFHFGNDEDIWSIWVTGDSKLVLATRARSSKLFRYDLKEKKRLPDIALKGIAQAKIIRMGSSNDACY